MQTFSNSLLNKMMVHKNSNLAMAQLEYVSAYFHNFSKNSWSSVASYINVSSGL